MLRAELLEGRDVPAAVAYGDFVGDGREYRAVAEGGTVAVWDVTWDPAGNPPPLLGSFDFDPGFAGELRLDSATVAGGADLLVAAAGPGGGPRVSTWAWGGAGFTQTLSVFAFSAEFRGGISAGGLLTHDTTGDGTDEVCAIAGKDGGPHAMIFGLDGTPLASFFVGPAADRSGLYHWAPAGEGLRGYSPDPGTGLLVVDRGEPDPVTMEVSHSEAFDYAGSRYNWVDVGGIQFLTAEPLPPYA